MTSNTTPAAFNLADAVRDALADMDRALTGHTGNNHMVNAYRLRGARATIAEVIAIRAAGGTLYSGPAPSDLDKKPSNEELAAWYLLPDRASAAARIAETAKRFKLPADHILLTYAPSQSEVSALLKSTDPVAKLADISKEASERAAKREREERERLLKKSVTRAKTLRDLDADTGLAWTKAIEDGADPAALREAWVNADLEPPADAAPGKK